MAYIEVVRKGKYLIVGSEEDEALLYQLERDRELVATIYYADKESGNDIRARILRVVKRRAFQFEIFNDDILKAKDVPENTPLQAHLYSERNIRHHRKFFALIKDAVEKLELDRIGVGHEELIYYLKEKQGMKQDRRGEIRYGSISEKDMTQIEFNAFYNRALDTICELVPTEKPELLAYFAENY